MRQAAVKFATMMVLPLLIVAIAGCGSSQAGPLRALSVGGQPIVDGASVQVPPGSSADFTAFIYNPLKSPIRLLSATIVPVTGHLPVGRLLHVGIGTTKGIAGASTGWPIHGLPTRQLKGALVGHGQSNIIFGITGPVSGRNYYVAGVKIGYEYQGQNFYVTAWSAAVACVTTRFRDRHFQACPGASARTQNTVEHMARRSS
jgi:hypothetical protein